MGPTRNGRIDKPKGRKVLVLHGKLLEVLDNLGELRKDKVQAISNLEFSQWMHSR